MYSNIRRKDRLLSEEESLAIIDACEYAVISCVDEQGEIFSIPLSIARIEKSIYIHGAKVGSKSVLYQNGRKVKIVCVSENQTPVISNHRFDEIKNQPKALATEIFTTKYKSAICTAMAYQVKDINEKKLGLQKLCEKYCTNYMSVFDLTADYFLDKLHIYRFDITEITGKSNKNNFQAA